MVFYSLLSTKNYLKFYSISVNQLTWASPIKITSISLGVLVFSMAIIFILLRLYKNKEKNPSIPQTIWKANDLYDSKQSLSLLDVDSSDLNGLPDWLRNRKEMIFSKNSIENGKLLGKGQFGNVYKGKFRHGNAV